MLQRIRVAALAVVLGAGTLALASPPATASATAASAPTITPVTLAPAAPVVVFDADVPVTFTFTTRNAATASLKVDGATVPVTSTPAGGGLKWTGTKAFGPAAVGRHTVVAATGPASTSGSFDVVRALTTAFPDFDASPDSVERGDTVRLSGRLVADREGYAGQTVAITFRERGTDAYREVAKVTTGRGGWFRTRVRAEATGWWRAEFAATATARAAVADADRVDVRRDLDSRIVGFDARPQRVERGDRLTFTGALLVERRGGVPGRRVSIEFKADGSRRWEHVTDVVTGRDGRFRALAQARVSGWWRADYQGGRGVDGSVSAADRVRVDPARAESRLVAFDARPEPVRRGRSLTMTGLLQAGSDGWWRGHRGKVALLFKPLGGTKWQHVKWVWSNGGGRLTTTTRAWSSGHWKFAFAGDARTRGDDSRTDYVRVRR
ncbi:hypothetical protein SAMN05421874_104323 [Nonomuraea maritima]|uniref:Ig-like domain (Group 3) n=1 Tax=Nonomuraea maritima TaxID=683260 RepID=A0A1G8YBN4_9ACTN|nr:hypothetical protein [Nonomuraea maritima]SDJ99470.1 hypothetical protein SAMN05421874_104323 [Nonomuraea maritima]